MNKPYGDYWLEGSIIGAIIVLFIMKTTLGAPCPVEGDDPKPALQALDRLKNRTEITQLNATVTLTAMLAPGKDHDRFNEGQSASITGFILKVKDGGPETANCHAKDEMHKDTHIVVGRKGDPPNMGVVVEVTPRMKALHPDWTTSILRSRYLGKLVTFSGPLMFDYIHTDISFTDNPNGQHNARWTPWEIHPVTDIKFPIK
jgi:hypothetical protein